MRLPRRRAAGAAALLFGIALVAGTGWLAYTAGRARAQLTAAAAELAAGRRAWSAGDGGAERASLVAAARDAAAARRLTGDPVWVLASAIPVAGDPARTVRGLADATDGLTRTALPALLAASDAARPAELVSAGNTVDVDRISAAAVPLRSAVSSLQQAESGVRRLPASWLPPVRRARSQFLEQVRPLLATTREAERTAEVVPPMLGRDGPRRYFVGFQNPAEARGTGGLLDAFAIFTADRGRIVRERVGSNAQLPDPPARVTGLDQAYLDRYRSRGATSLWVNSNLSADFPEVASAWAAMWRAGTGERIDGALLLDPSALSGVLGVLGPVTVPGLGQVDAARVAPLVMQDQYRIRAGVAARKGVMLGIGTGTMDAVLGRRGDRAALLDALVSSARAGHVLVSSRVPVEEAALTAAGVTGALPRDGSPFVQGVVVNAAGGKLDAYLDSAVTYRLAACSATGRHSVVTVALHNDAPTRGLPAYVTVRGDGGGAVEGQNRLDLSIVLGRGAVVRGATLDGTPLPMAPGSGQLPAWLDLHGGTALLQPGEMAGLPSFGLPLELAPGARRVVRLDVEEPPSTAAAVVRSQPMARPQRVVVQDAGCSAGGS